MVNWPIRACPVGRNRLKSNLPRLIRARRVQTGIYESGGRATIGGRLNRKGRLLYEKRWDRSRDGAMSETSDKANDDRPEQPAPSATEFTEEEKEVLTHLANSKR